jgi:hypothetical protein
LEYFERQNYGPFVHPQIQAFMEAVFTSYIEEGDSLITKNRLLKFYDQYITP